MDQFLKWGAKPFVRQTVRQLGLPVTLPPRLLRSRAPWGARIVADRPVALWLRADSRLNAVLASILARSGAQVLLCSDGDPERFAAAAAAWSEPLAAQVGPEADERLYGVIIDGTPLEQVSDLAAIYEFMSSRVRSIQPGGRVVLLANQSAEGAEARAVARALEGFARSLGKELGRRGITVNLLRCTSDCAEGLAGPLRYFLSAHSSFVTLQPLTAGRIASGPAGSCYDALPLSGQLAVVTGAARGIGLATAQALKREGAKLLLVDHPASRTPASLAARELGAELLLTDLALPGAKGELAAAVGTLGGVDVLVHNAGVTRDRTLARMTREEWDLVLAVNLQAVIGSTSALLGAGLVRRDARLVLLSSVGGIAGNPGQTNYGATKAGLLGYCAALAEVFEAEGAGRTVNAVAPGFIETRMTAAMPTLIKQAARRLSALNQGGLAGDVAEAVTFLALPSSGGVNGQVLRVCGGALIGA